MKYLAVIVSLLLFACVTNENGSGDVTVAVTDSCHLVRSNGAFVFNFYTVTVPMTADSVLIFPSDWIMDPSGTPHNDISYSSAHAYVLVGGTAYKDFFRHGLDIDSCYARSP